jgi:hypothetical protein
MYASYKGFVEIVRLLLSHRDIDVFLKNNVRNVTCIYYLYDLFLRGSGCFLLLFFCRLFRMAKLLLTFVATVLLLTKTRNLLLSI